MPRISPTDRFPPIPVSQWTEDQIRFSKPLIDSPRGGVIGPFVPLLRSPELMDRAQHLGAYLRYGSAIGKPLSELAILITARHWTQQVEWAIHAPIATAAGLSPHLIESIAKGQRPGEMSPEEAAVHDFSIELHQKKRVSDEAFESARRFFGEKGVVDLMAILGYYTFLSMLMNGAQTEPPHSSASLLEDLPPQ